MGKLLMIIVVVTVILVAGFFAFNSYIYNEKQGDNTESIQLAEDMNTSKSPIKVTPISHATMVLHLGGQVIYNDPVGGAEAFAGQPSPNIILVSDIHGDHLNAETLAAVSKEDSVIVMPQAVKDMITQDIAGTIVILKNGEKTMQKGIEIEGVPMYNVPESPDARHTKGRGNGYILSAEGKRIYIAGDTGPTPEMKALQNIDVAFVPMDPPFTMTVEEAAVGVLAFKPKFVHPYHFRGQDGLSDVNKFKELVETGDPNITVEIFNFYPEQ